MKKVVQDSRLNKQETIILHLVSKPNNKLYEKRILICKLYSISIPGILDNPNFQTDSIAEAGGGMLLVNIL
ncbi:hypothetical protein DVR12_21280 [Chitinophaga silvatica]|uniref:Uncharacterized protein n=1 Tax=Chitinophaga silvatica TaxID=2282649 RepID=A0A3E1Y4N6_9BACT|nr:hypothetical protein [Chitinophaga silvatica]RFS19639.1 hypothetical protein DVR12_21280 [Chitinophaga silvatica]